RAGTVSYLNVVVAQTAALTSEQTAVGITGRRLGASVLLIKALGGGWSADRLPTDREVTRLLGRGMARRLDETHPNLTLADQNRQERGRRRLGESKTPSDLGGCGKARSPRHRSAARSRARPTSLSYRDLPLLLPIKSCYRSDVIRIDTDQRREPDGPRRGRTLARDGDAVGDKEKPARPGLVPVGARTTHRSFEVADDEADPHAPDRPVVRRNHLDEREPEPSDRLADLERRRPPVGGRNQDVLGDPSVRFQDQPPAEERFDA